MPKRMLHRRSRRPVKRRRVRRSGVMSARGPSRSISRGQSAVLRIPTMGCLPPRCRVRLTYQTTNVLGNGTVTGDSNIYRLNSPFDPDYTGTGSSAIGFATFANLYDRYYVHGHHAVVSAQQRDNSNVTANSISAMVGCTVADAIPSDPVGNWDTESKFQAYKLINMPRGSGAGGIYRMYSNICSRNTTGFAVPASGANANRYTARSWNGPTQFAFRDKRVYPKYDPMAAYVDGALIPHPQDGRFPLTAASTGVPLDGMFLQVWAWSIPINASTILPLPYTHTQVEITYDVEFYSPQQVEQADVRSQAGGYMDEEKNELP